MKLLEVEDFGIEFHDHDRPEQVVEDVDFTLDKGEILGKPDTLDGEVKLQLSHGISELALSGRVVKEKVCGVNSYVGAFKCDNAYLVAVYPVSEAREAWNFRRGRRDGRT